LEDLIVTKLVPLKEKDYGNIKEVFKLADKMDFEYLGRRVQKANLKREFSRITKRIGVPAC